MSKPFKYDEEAILSELHDYLLSTYGQHYVGKNNIQAMDLFIAADDAESFCKCNAIKYLLRYGKKSGKNRKDLLKAVHYTILMMHLNNEDSRDETK
jgi:hypothetical protein